MIKKFFINTLFFIILSCLINCLYYYELFPKELISILNLILFILFFSINSYILYRKKKDILPYIIPSIFIIVSFLLQIINHQFHSSVFLYYFIILFSTYLGCLLKKHKKRS